jgi:hypothetical protein
LVRGRAFASAVNESTPRLVGTLALSVRPGPKYQVRAVVPATGNDEKSLANPAKGSPGFELLPGEDPAPLSKSTRTGGSFSYAASAAAYVGISWIGSGGSVTTSVCGRPMAAW